MSHQRYSLENLPKEFTGIPVLRVNPKSLDELFRISVVTKHAQRLLQSGKVSPYTLALQSKINVYQYKQVVVDGHILVELPRTAADFAECLTLKSPEVRLVEKDEIERLLVLTDGKVGIKGGTEAEKQVVKDLWKETDKDLPLLTRILGIAKEAFWGLMYKKRPLTAGVTYPFPLFRSPLLSVFEGNKREVLDLVLEKLRQRYVAKRDLKQVPSEILVTPNLDHLRYLFELEDPTFQEVYRNSFIHTPDGYPPLVMYGKASLGHQPSEQVTGVDLFIQLINIIGNESLPYTIYLIGGFGNVPYKTRDYFISIHPHLKDNFVGISTPPMGFLNDKETMEAIVADIEQKKPDIIFAGMTVPTQEYFVHTLKTRGVNFGIAFCIGRAIELISGYQKKEPTIIDKLHLAWIYRMIFGSKKEIRKRQRARVVKDFKFVFKTLFSK